MVAAGAGRLALLFAAMLAFATPVRADGPSAPVRLGDETLFTLSEPLGKLDPAARARAAEEVLKALVREPRHEVEVALRPHSATILVGATTVLEVGEADLKGADKPDLPTYAREIARTVRVALEREQRRAAIAKRVLSLSSVVFLGLVALLLLRAVGHWAKRAASWVEGAVRPSAGLRIHTVELLNPSTTREGLRVLVLVALWSLRIAIVFGWGIMTLSLFESTRLLAQRTTGKLFAPGLQFLERLAAEVPVAFATLLALFLVFVAVRFTLTYFAAIERGELESDWARPETAIVTGRLLAAATVLGSFLFVSPLLTGSENGVLTRLGVLAVAALALASTPLWASCALGVRLVYGGSVRRGDVVSYGGQRGRVERISLFDLTLLADDETVIRVPHLMSLWHPTRVSRAGPRSPETSGQLPRGDASDGSSL